MIIRCILKILVCSLLCLSLSSFGDCEVSVSSPKDLVFNFSQMKIGSCPPGWTSTQPTKTKIVSLKDPNKHCLLIEAFSDKNLNNINIRSPLFQLAPYTEYIISIRIKMEFQKGSFQLMEGMLDENGKEILKANKIGPLLRIQSRVPKFWTFNVPYIPGNGELHLDIFGKFVRHAGKAAKFQPEIKKSYLKLFVTMMPKGKVWIKNVSIRERKSFKGIIEPTKLYRKDDESWFPFTLSAKKVNSSILDVSYLLEKPSGRHGFLTTTKDGHFAFEDRTRIRFWGANIMGPMATPEKEDADTMTDYLAQCGINLVRICPVNLVNPSYPKGPYFDLEKIDKLDYMLAQLKKRGIYYFFIGAVSEIMYREPFKSKLGRGKKLSKGFLFFSPEHNKEIRHYWKNFYTKKNRYTGLELKDDPSMVLFIITNENDLVLEYPKIILQRNKFRKKIRILHEQYQTWLKKKGRPVPDKIDKIKDETDFLYDVETEFYLSCINFLRGIGIKVPITGTNWFRNLRSYLCFHDCGFDFSAQHHYGPYFTYNKKRYHEFIANVSMLDDRFPFRAINIAKGKIKDKPFIQDEWNTGFPNNFRGEMVMFMGVFSLFQEWDAPMIHTFFHQKRQMEIDNAGSPALLDNSNISAFDPSRAGLFPAIALMYHRQYIAPAKKTININSSSSELRGDPDFPKRSNRWGYLTKYGHMIGLVHKVQASLGEDCIEEGCAQIRYSQKKDFKRCLDELIKSGFANPKLTVFQTDNEEITVDYERRLLLINADFVQGVSGYLDCSPPVKLKSITFGTSNDFVNAVAVSVDNRTLDKSKKILVTIVGDSTNKGDFFEYPSYFYTMYGEDKPFRPGKIRVAVDKKAKKRLFGVQPIVVQPIIMTVRLKTEYQEDLSVYPISSDGLRKREIKTVKSNGSISFKANGNKYKTIYYEISADN